MTEGNSAARGIGLLKHVEHCWDPVFFVRHVQAATRRICTRLVRRGAPDFYPSADTSWRFWGLYVHVCKVETLREAYELAEENDGVVPIVNPIRWQLIENRAMLLLDV